MSDRIRTFIFGSCVSRDTLETMTATHEIIRYVARQSFISVNSPASGVLGQLQPLESAFQERMVSGDVAGDLIGHLKAHADDIDLLVIDLVDERGGVIAVGGGYVTRLQELWEAGGAVATRAGTHIPFGTDAHYALWSRAATSLVETIRELGLAERAAVIKTPWAQTLDTGEDVDMPAWMLAPVEADRRYERYFGQLGTILPVIELPDELARSSRSHKWGVSPFHYQGEAYDYLARELRRRGRQQRNGAASDDPM